MDEHALANAVFPRLPLRWRRPALWALVIAMLGGVVLGMATMVGQYHSGIMPPPA